MFVKKGSKCLFLADIKEVGETRTPYARRHFE